MRFGEAYSQDHIEKSLDRYRFVTTNNIFYTSIDTMMIMRSIQVFRFKCHSREHAFSYCHNNKSTNACY